MDNLIRLNEECKKMNETLKLMADKLEIQLQPLNEKFEILRNFKYKVPKYNIQTGNSFASQFHSIDCRDRFTYVREIKIILD